MPESEDLRANLEAAIDQLETEPVVAPTQESAETTPEVTEPNVAETNAETTEVTELAKPVESAEPTDTEATPPQDSVEPPPQAWKAPLKAKWGSLDPEVRKEILRREQDITREFGVSGQARKLANDFHEVTRPYEARMRALGVTPLQATNELLKADYILSTAPPRQRATLIAKLIKDYNIDVEVLDSVLAGEQVDPSVSAMEQMIQQRLAPLQSFVQEQQQQAEAAQAARTAAMQAEVDAMANNVKEYPHFETVRMDMADIIQLASARGQSLTLQEAYARAVQVNPETAAQIAAAATKKQQMQQAQSQASEARRAQAASVSVKGAPQTTQSKGPTSIRDDLEQAFAQLEGR